MDCIKLITGSTVLEVVYSCCIHHYGLSYTVVLLKASDFLEETRQVSCNGWGRRSAQLNFTDIHSSCSAFLVLFWLILIYSFPCIATMFYKILNLLSPSAVISTSVAKLFFWDGFKPFKIWYNVLSDKWLNRCFLQSLI